MLNKEHGAKAKAESKQTGGRRPETGFKYFPYISIIFVTVLLISNIVAQKLVPVGPFIFTAGIFLFPVSYIIGDVLTEVYGFENARKIIWIGFGTSFFMVVIFWIVIKLPPAAGWNNQEAFNTVLYRVPRIVFASLTGYLAGEFVNSFILSKLKVLQKGRHLWIRTISSTIGGEAVDTILFVLIGFYGVFPMEVLITTIWSGYIFKVLYEAAATPLTYIVVNHIKRLEGRFLELPGNRFEQFDNDVSYNPFKF